ncbi:predicted protein [Nematostella vectensis]|uniref:Condensation domain-containing protein n=1 Tax=Nematostella vectensis TaxID=45351 RepID=A7REQ3_NEMVE|nr:predicted protein [Nematostella vectensis]|eukprot:XP_001642017.1 predicted protein [Nematostella vectensis]
MDEPETGIILWAIEWINENLTKLGATAVYTLFLMTIMGLLRGFIRKRRQHDEDSKQESSFRKLCKYESALDTLHKYGGSITANVLLVRSRVSVSTSKVRRALSCLTKRHPLLRTMIDRRKVYFDGKKRIEKYLKEMEVTNFAEHHLRLKATTADKWITVFERELQKQFPPKGPLWRFVMLKEQFDPEKKTYFNAFVLSTHFLICDGVSALAFFKEFLDYLNSEGQDVENETSFKLLPTFSNLIHHHASAKSLSALLDERAKTIIHKLFSRLQTKAQKPCKNIFTSKFSPVILKNPTVFKKTCILPMSLSKIEVNQLVRVCQKRQCTVHGAFTAAASIAMSVLLDDSDNEGFTTIPASVQINTRKYCSPVAKTCHLGCFVLNCSFESKAKPSAEFWEVAKYSSDAIHQAITEGKHLQGVRLNLPYSSQNIPLGELSNDDTVAGRTADLFNISNLGKYVNESFGEGEQPLSFAGFYHAVAEHNVGPVFSHNIATVNGTLFWGMTYHTNVVVDKVARNYADLVLATLKKAVEKP